MPKNKGHLRLVTGHETRPNSLLEPLDNPPLLGKLVTNQNATVREGIARVHRKLFADNIPLPGPFKKIVYNYELSQNIFDRSIGVSTIIGDHYKNRTLRVRYGGHILSRLLERRPGLKSYIADHYALTHVAVGNIEKSPAIVGGIALVAERSNDVSTHGRRVALWRLAGGLAANELFSEQTQEKMRLLYEQVGASVLADLNIQIETLKSVAATSGQDLPERFAIIPAPVAGLLSPIMPSAELEAILGPDIGAGTSR